METGPERSKGQRLIPSTDRETPNVKNGHRDGMTLTTRGRLSAGNNELDALQVLVAHVGTIEGTTQTMIEAQRDVETN